MKVYFYVMLSLGFLISLPFEAANQAKRDRTVENIEYYKKLVQQTRHEVDSLLSRLPDLISSEKSGRKVNKKIKKVSKRVKKVSEDLPKIITTNIPDTLLEPDLGIFADTVEVVIIKKEKLPFFKRIFRKIKIKKK